MGVAHSQTPRDLRERNLPYRHSNHARKYCRHDSKSDVILPFVTAESDATYDSKKYHPAIKKCCHI